MAAGPLPLPLSEPGSTVPALPGVRPGSGSTSGSTSGSGALVAAALGALMFLVGAGMVWVLFSTDIGLGYGGGEMSMLTAPVTCGNQLEWAIGGGPSTPGGTEVSGPEARALCHQHYDEDVAGWRTQAVMGLVLMGVGGVVAVGGARRARL